MNRSVSKYWVSQAHPGVGLLRARLTDPEFPPHVHDSLVIAVTESGGARIKARGAAFVANRAHALVFNPHEPHSSTGSGAAHWQYRGFYLRGAALDQMLEKLHCAPSPYFKRNAIADAELVAALIDWHRALENEDLLAIEEKAMWAMGLLCSRHAEKKTVSSLRSKDEAIVRQLVSQLERRFDEPVHLVELADQVGLTQYQLISLFKASLGMTPYSMLTQIRLTRACALLIGGTHICEAAVAAGFYDQSALTKHFKRRFGVTPAQFAHARSS